MINEHSVKTISLCNLVIVISFHLEMLQFRKNYFDCSVMSPEKTAFTNTFRTIKEVLDISHRKIIQLFPKWYTVSCQTWKCEHTECLFKYNLCNPYIESKCRMGKFSVTCHIKPYTANKIMPQKNKTKQNRTKTKTSNCCWYVLVKKRIFPKIMLKIWGRLQRNFF